MVDIIPRGTLSDADLDVLSGMMIIFMHSAEKILQVMENHYFAEYRAGAEYKQLCKQYGKAAVDKAARDQIQHIVRGDERNKLGKILKAAENFHYQMQTLTESAFAAHGEEITDADSMTAIIHDTNVLCYLYALMGNCDGKDDEIKIISTIKAFAKGKRVSENVLNKLNYMQQ